MKNRFYNLLQCVGVGIGPVIVAHHAHLADGHKFTTHTNSFYFQV